MPVVFATATKVARIELDEEEAKRVNSIEPETFIDISDFPTGIKLKVAETETLTAEAQALVREGILDMSESEVE